MEEQLFNTLIERKAPPGKFRVLSIANQNFLKDAKLIKDCDTVSEAFILCTDHNYGNDITRTYYCFDDQGNQPGDHSTGKK